MWFGDLVTMKWWDDLWLNESFAEWACYHAAVEATEFTEAWTGFANARKNWAYRQDQLPSTHPIAADNVDLQAVEVNFDGITYAKGASVLKQLVAWVGLENVPRRPPRLLQGLRVRQHRVHRPARGAGGGVRPRAGLAGPRSGCRPPGVNTLRRRSSSTPTARYTSFAVEQTAHPDYPTLRRHRLGIGLYDERRRPAWSGVRPSRSTSRATATDVAELVGEQQPDLVLLNDGDLTYAKIRLDERSLATVVGGLGTLDDSLARALCWGAAWDMTRDAEMRATDFVDLVLSGIGAETDAFGVSRIPGYAAPGRQQLLRPGATGPRCEATWEHGLRELLDERRAGQRPPARLRPRPTPSAAHSDEALDRARGAARRLAGLRRARDRHRPALAPAHRRWPGRPRRRRPDRRRAGARQHHLRPGARRRGPRAASPTAEAKAEAWEIAMVRDDVPNETQRSIVLAFQQPGQDDVLAPYVEKYLDAADTMWEEQGHPARLDRAGVHLPAAARHARSCSTASTPGWRRRPPTRPPSATSHEGRADVARALAAQAKDAQA